MFGKSVLSVVVLCLLFLFPSAGAEELAHNAPLSSVPEAYIAETQRNLKFYNIHTKEKIDVVFWVDGRFNRRGLKRLNYFLRDWRANEVREIDPDVLDLVYKIRTHLEPDYPHLKTAYLHIISGYRSPETNAKMRRAGRGMAKNSQHIYGRAIDIHFPGVPTHVVRDVARSFRAGGVGYYPSAGFIHVDTGRVRSW